MKKQLIILFFLLGGLPVLGMNSGAEDYRTVFLKSLQKKEFELAIFKTIHQNIYQYFKADQTQESRQNILEWIMQKLPFMPGEYREEDNQMIQYYRDDSSEFIATVLEEPENAVKLFNTIYIAYLRLNLRQLCKVLFAYFDEELMKNIHYRSILISLIRMLGSYLDHLLLSLPLEKEFKEECNSMSNSAVEYIENYRESDTSDQNRDLFTIHYQNTKTICGYFGSVLQAIEQRRISEEKDLQSDSSDKEPAQIISEQPQPPVTSGQRSEPTDNSLPRDEFAAQNQSSSDQNQEPIIHQKQLLPAPVSQAALTAEPISAPATMWETIVEGIQTFFEWIWHMNG